MQSSTVKPKRENYQAWFAFMLKITAIWLSWKVVSYLLGDESTPLEQRIFPAISAVWETINDNVRRFVLDGAELLLNILGYVTENTGYILRIGGSRGIGLGNYCLGFNLLYYFLMLLLVSKIRWKLRLIGLVVSVILINALNIFRITFLNLVLIYSPSLLPLLHDYIFNAIVAGCLFLYYLSLLRHK